MKVKIPKTIQVVGHTYKVLYKSHLSKDRGIRGRINHRLQEIQIEPENPVSQKNQTMLHEILHFIETTFAMDLSDDDIDRLAEGLYQVLSDSFGIEFDWSNIESPTP